MGRDQVLRILQSDATISSSNGSFHCSLLTVVHLLDFQEGPEGDDHFEFCLNLLERQYPPTLTEVRACWELCRLQNGKGCATVFLPVAMVYHAYPELTGAECLTRAVIYFFLCIGIKCLIMTIDDILDYDIDANVERTKNRTLPRGAIGIERAWLFFALQVLVGVFLAYKVLSPDALQIFMYVWPFGLMFNIGVYMGWADLAPDGVIPYQALTAAHLGATMWTVTYETLYQHQDKVDDVKIHMKSLAILCGKHTIPICSATTVGLTAIHFGQNPYANRAMVMHSRNRFVMEIQVLDCASVLGQGGRCQDWHEVASHPASDLNEDRLVTDIDKPMQCMQLFLHMPTSEKLRILAGLVVDAVVHWFVEGIPLQPPHTTVVST
ncbi:hypothetical protein EDD85DRAFT_1025361 [Armillaria nabsnona]|nr:hypothetical protein EDD85DRAFT_1025361 [Armillaria nabsnona]